MPSITIGNMDKKINSTKNTFSGTTLSCKLKEPCSMQNPTFMVQGLTKGQVYNYCSFEGRYYWVDDIVYETRDIQNVVCHLDPLATYKDAIKATTGFINFGPKDLWDKRLVDSRFAADRVFMSDTPIYVGNSSPLFSMLSGSGCVVMRIMNYKTASNSCGVATIVGPLSAYLALLNVYVTDLDTDVGNLGNNYEKLVGKMAGLGNALDSILSAYWLPVDINVVSNGTNYDGDIGGYSIGSGWKMANNYFGTPFFGGPEVVDIPISNLWATYPWLLTPNYTKITVSTPGGQVDISDVIYNFSSTQRISLTFTFYWNIDGDCLLVCRETDSDKTLFVHSWNMAIDVKRFAKSVQSGVSLGIKLGTEVGLSIVGGIAGAGAGIAMAGKTITKKARQKGVSGADAARFGNLTARAGDELTEQANDFQDASNGIGGAVASLNMAQGSREFSGTNTITSLFINGTDATAWKTPIKITVIRFIPEIMGDLGHYSSFCDQHGWPVLNYGDLSVDGPYQMAGATCHADAPPGVLSTINSTINSLIIIE